MKHIDMLQTAKKKKYSSDFDVDLEFGQKYEEQAKAMLLDKRSTFEFKTERNYWYKTGNMAVEVECYGKPSGISITKAKYWCVMFVYNNKLFERRIFDVPVIKRLVKKYYNKMKVGGDYNMSRFILVPLKEFYSEEFMESLLFEAKNLNGKGEK